MSDSQATETLDWPAAPEAAPAPPTPPEPTAEEREAAARAEEQRRYDGIDPEAIRRKDERKRFKKLGLGNRVYGLGLIYERVCEVEEKLDAVLEQLGAAKPAAKAKGKK